MRHNCNLGVSEARNTGLSHACGEFISFCDADDLMEPQMLERMVNSIIESGSDLAICGYSLINENGSITTEPEDIHIHKDLLNSLILTSDKLMRKVFLITPAPWCKMFRNTNSENNISSNRFDPELCHGEDLLWTIQAVLKAHLICIVPEALYRYRECKGSLSFSHKGVMNSQLMFGKIRKVINDSGYGNMLSLSFQQMFYLHNLYLLEHVPPEEKNTAIFLISKELKELGFKDAPVPSAQKNMFRILFKLFRPFTGKSGKLWERYELVKLKNRLFSLMH